MTSQECIQRKTGFYTRVVLRLVERESEGKILLSDVMAFYLIISFYRLGPEIFNVQRRRLQDDSSDGVFVFVFFSL